MIRSPLQLGEYAGFALKSDGTVYAWGDNQYGELGNGTTTNGSTGISTPVQVSGLTGITAIASGGIAGYALKSDGTVYAWGNNGVGQLGNGTTTTNTTPVQVSGLTGITTIASGGDTGYAVDDGEVQLEPPAADAVLQDDPRRAAVTRRETVGVVDYGETSFGCGGFSGSVGSARRCLVSDRRLLR